MSLVATTAAFEAKGLSPVQRLVLLIYADHCDENGKCWPSQSTVAKKAEISRQSVNRASKDLEQMGFISIQRRSNEGGGQTSSIVTINIDFCRQGVSQKVTGGETQDDRGVKHGETGGETQVDTNLPLNLPLESKPPLPPKGGKSPRSFDPLNLDLPHGQRFREAWHLWCAHRHELGGKHRLKPTSSSQQLKRLAAMSESRAVATIEHSVANGWVGLREPDPPKHNGKPVYQPKPAKPCTLPPDYAEIEARRRAKLKAIQ